MKNNLPHNYNYDKAARLLDEFNFLDVKQDDELKACKLTYKIIDDMQDIERFETDEAWNKLHKRIEASELNKKQNLRKLSLNKWYQVAAAITIVVGIASMMMWFFSEPNAKLLTVNNPTDTPKIIELSDGSMVSLNKGASLTYPKRFKENKRAVEFHGEGFFDIEPNANRPFTIKVGQALVTVLGTSFNINEQNSGVEVIVASGKVKLSYENQPLNNVILVSGDKGNLSAETVLSEKNHNENYLSWLNKKLIFKEAPLSMVVADLNKAYHADIVLGSADVENLEITTTFNKQPLNEVVESIALALELNIKKSGKKYILEY